MPNRPLVEFIRTGSSMAGHAAITNSLSGPMNNSGRSRAPRAGEPHTNRRPPLWLAALAVSSLWGALYDLGRTALLFALHPFHIDFRVFYVAAQAGLERGWSSIYDLQLLRSLSSGFPANERFIDRALPLSARSSTTAISAPAWAVCPSLARFSRRISGTGAGISALTLSVSTSS